MEKLKPHIQFTSGEFLRSLGFKFLSPPHWYCIVPSKLFFAWGAYGSGDTPMAAYNAWAMRAGKRVKS